MPKHLVIVESPAKAKTIKKYLGANFEVIASNGHVRDLPKSQLGVDVEGDFEPKYITIRGKGDVLAKLRREVKRADRVYLATDPDREGEAISWHLAESLKLDPDKYSRISFNEITKNAVKNSLKNARDIDMNLVDAQQARRILDRVVGYEISPLLWEKIKRGLSAGRVQSATLRLICDRENEINEFVPKEYWQLVAELSSPDVKKNFKAQFYGTKKEKIELTSEDEVNEIMKKTKGKKVVVSETKTSKRLKKAPLPFTTSTLQQEASKQLNFSTQKTMKTAQQLYEGVEVKGHGTIGLITYLRTDSTRISDEAETAVKDYIVNNLGEDLYSANSSKGAENKKIQDAHEAIRPSYVDITPSELKNSLPRDLFRLYQLIWKRFVASRMQEAEYDTTSVKIDVGDYRFTSSSSSLSKAGCLSVYADKEEDEEEEETSLSLTKLSEKSTVKAEGFEKSQHFTAAPAHFTEASLVKAMEELGIGRPSTYAPTITLLLGRHYVTKEAKNLYVTELGEAVNNMMKDAFSEIVDLSFTATMETLLDGVAEGTVSWKSIVKNFYPDLEVAISAAKENLSKLKIEDEVSDTPCEICGRMMVIKFGPHGKFLACPGFPECKNTKPYFEKTGVECPKCKKELIICKTKKGRRYFGCSGYPECDYMTWQLPKKETQENQ
ncbi:MAG: type I DNA topoisomerase [Lachnospiraceae bacterium]|nr:type I DNA topoisomerase [Lachnospiraceae bacterium]